MFSLITNSETWLTRSAIVIAIYPLLTILSLSALGLLFAITLLPLPDNAQMVIFIPTSILWISSGFFLSVLTPLFLLAVLYDIYSIREHRDVWNPSWGYLSVFLVHGAWLTLGWVTARKAGRSNLEFLGEWYYSLVPLPSAIILLYYLYNRSREIGVPFRFPPKSD